MISRKVSVHIIGDNFDPAQLGRPTVVKLHNASVDFKNRVRTAVGPGCLIVVRWQYDAVNWASPSWQAAEWFYTHRERIQAMADPNTVFECLNEPPDDQAVAFGIFGRYWLQAMHGASLRAAVGSWSVGCPDLSAWATYRPVLDAMGPGDVISCHEYWSNHADINNRWHCGRWTMVPELAGKALVVTEAGRDRVENAGQPGWQRTCNAEEYLDDLRAYGTLLDQYPNVIGATVFTGGDLSGGWEAFGVNGIWPRVVAEYPPETATLQPEYFWSDRQGQTIRYIVIHDTEGSAEAALAWWKDISNPYLSSAHDLIRTSGELIHCVAYDKAAHHAGGSAIPGYTGNPNMPSIGIELEYPAAPATPGWPAAQIEALVMLVRGLVASYSIPRANIYRHSDIDPVNRSDPRNFPWGAFLDAVFGPVSLPVVLPAVDSIQVQEAVRRQAWDDLGVDYNPEAAYARYARLHSMGVPQTQEFDLAVDGLACRAQGFAKGIVYSQVGDWGNIYVAEW